MGGPPFRIGFHRSRLYPLPGGKEKVNRIANGAIISLSVHGFRRFMILDSGFRRNDDKAPSFPTFVTPAKAGVQFEGFKRKGLSPNDGKTIMEPFYEQKQ
jgi:hypothetical protein